MTETNNTRTFTLTVQDWLDCMKAQGMKLVPYTVKQVQQWLNECRAKGKP